MVKVEEVPARNHEEDISSDSETDDEMPTLEHAENDPQVAGRIKLNRAEKKARKAMQKVGMKPVPGVFRVTVKKMKTQLFVITKPDVVKSANSDIYVVFGEAKMEDLSAQAQQSAAQRFTHTPEVAKVGHSSMDVKRVEEVDESSVDETGLEPKDIELVMSQASCSRGRAVVALREANGDLVEAIMQISA